MQSNRFQSKSIAINSVTIKSIAIDTHLQSILNCNQIDLNCKCICWKMSIDCNQHWLQMILNAISLISTDFECKKFDCSRYWLQLFWLQLGLLQPSVIVNNCVLSSKGKRKLKWMVTWNYVFYVFFSKSDISHFVLHDKFDILDLSEII